MTLKTKLSLGVSLLITLLFAASSVLIYSLFADFRRDEVEVRLRQSGIATTRLVASLWAQGAAIPQNLDESSIETLDEEVVIVFDSSRRPIYSNVTDKRFFWRPADLEVLAKEHSFFRAGKGRETYGLRYEEGGKRFYTLLSAPDEIGNRKQQFLLYILLGTGLLFTLLAWVVPARLVGHLLQPLDSVLQQVKAVHAHTLDTRIAVQNKEDEIALLANEFNGMMERIELSYQRQKEFTAHASHELRTPIARLSAQLENQLLTVQSEGEKAFLSQLLTDVNRLSELIASLLLLARADNPAREQTEACRPDELLFEAAEQVSRDHPDFRMRLDIQSAPEGADIAEIFGVRSLLQVAFFNLLQNGWQYSENGRVAVTIVPEGKATTVTLENDGPTLTKAEQQKLFQPFMRGANARSQTGLGLGLRMVARIFEKHGLTIRYETGEDGVNRFVIGIPAQPSDTGP